MLIIYQSGTFSKEDRTTEIKEMIEHMFKDFDVDNDGRLVKSQENKKS